MKNIFISFPFEEQKKLKDKLINFLTPYAINYSEKEDRSHKTDEYIWSNLLKRIKGSSVTIVIHDRALLNEKAEYDYTSNDKSERFHNSGWVYKEIVGSLRDWSENRINGMIYLVPDYYWKDIVAKDSNGCIFYNKNNLPKIIYENMFNHKEKYHIGHSVCGSSYKDSFVDIVKESDFYKDPNLYISEAYDKRYNQIKNNEYEIKINYHLS